MDFRPLSAQRPNGRNLGEGKLGERGFGMGLSHPEATPVISAQIAQSAVDQNPEPAAATRLWPGRVAARMGGSLALLFIFGWLLSDRIAQIDIAAVKAVFFSLGVRQWLSALGFTGLSFWAVGRYDAVLHKHFCTSYPAHMARRAGICAIAVSQTLGLGVISGAILRWRMLPGVSLWRATRLTVAVALSFLAGWAVVTAIAILALPDAPQQGLAILVLAAAIPLAGVSILADHLPWKRLHSLRFRWPNGLTISHLLTLCAMDTVTAALAFYSLLPAGHTLDFATFLPAFLLALGAGLALGTPGGMGAFEITLLAQLPPQAEAEILATILAWRIVYYAHPAVIGAGLAIMGPRRHIAPPHLRPDLSGMALRAETGLHHQGNLRLCAVAGQGWLLGRTSHCLIAVLDPSSHASPIVMDSCLRGLDRMAQGQGRIPVAYKIGPRMAARARANGYALRRIGWEAWLNPTDNRLGSSCRSGLRRKLRRAETAGVTVRACPPDKAPWPELDQIARTWAATHGGERGFSMGRHERPYLARQAIYIAWKNGQPIAYASFHHQPDEWALDILRHGAELPDGTMYALVQAAITDAGAAGVTRLSLAAIPDAALPRGDGTRAPDLATRLMMALAPEAAAAGLYRFKASFAPRWSPLYLAASNRPGLILAGLALWRAITQPPPIMKEIEREHAEYGFASAPVPWHIARRRA